MCLQFNFCFQWWKMLPSTFGLISLHCKSANICPYSAVSLCLTCDLLVICWSSSKWMVPQFWFQRTFILLKFFFFVQQIFCVSLFNFFIWVKVKIQCIFYWTWFSRDMLMKFKLDDHTILLSVDIYFFEKVFLVQQMCRVSSFIQFYMYYFY